jgi:hypothetical protein
MNDFETVREALSDYLGSLPSAEDWDTPQDDAINRAHAALDRIETEMEKKAVMAQSAIYSVQVLEAEVLEAEVERLRAVLDDFGIEENA